MQITIHGIVLRTVRHSDSMTIVSVWTMERGRLTIALNAGNSPQGRRRRAIMMPLGMFEGVAAWRNGREMVTVSDLRPYRVGNVSALSPLKNLVAMFLADFLNAVLRESQPDPLMTEYIFAAVDALAATQGAALANFHLHFVFRLGHFIGISPDMGTYARGRYLDLREGVYVDTPPIHRMYLDRDASRLAYVLSVLDVAHLGLLRLNHDTRNRILDVMLEYYSMHHANLQSLHSLPVIRSL